MFEFLRYHPIQWKPGTLASVGHSIWVYRMINTQAPLEEKIALPVEKYSGLGSIN